MGTLISSSEVAELAGVAPSTVSNWRKRHDDFPEPAETTERGRDLFDLKEIERWLKEHRNLAEDALRSRFVFSAFAALRGDYSMSDAATVICTALTQRAHDLTKRPLDGACVTQPMVEAADQRVRRRFARASVSLMPTTWRPRLSGCWSTPRALRQGKGARNGPPAPA